MRVLVASLMLLAIGVACIVLENSFYQYIYNDGLLHESLFLPLGVICILLAGIGLVFALAKMLMRKRKRKY
jgi:hypothetical protein